MQKDRKLEIQFLKGVGPKRAQLLESELGAGTVSGLIRVYPYKYVDRSVIVPIAGVPVTSASVQVMGKVVSCTLLDKSGKAVDIDSPKPGSISRLCVTVADDTGQMEMV